MSHHDTTVELRGMCPRETVDVLDAISQARRVSRTDLVNDILASWCVDRMQEATLIQRITRGYPSDKDPSGRRVE